MLADNIILRNYIVIYLKSRGQLAAIVAVIVALPLLITALFYGVLWYDLLIPLVPVFLAGIYFAGCCICAQRFRSMIQHQTTQYHIPFPGAEGECLQRLLYLSQDWLVLAGRFALCRRNIAGIHMERKNPGSFAAFNQVTVTDASGKKYRFQNSNSSAITQIRRWLESDTYIR